MQKFDNDYDEMGLSSNIETEMLLSDLPLELIKENIKLQVASPLTTTVNFMTTVSDKFDTIQEIYSENPEAMANLKSISIDFYGFVNNKIDDAFDLGIDIDESSLGQLRSVSTSLYEFLVLRYKENITKFLIKYIKRNKKALAKQFEHYQKKKDVTSISLKRKLKDKESVLIIANLPEIIDHIISLEIDGDEFLDYVGDGYYEAELILDLIDASRMSGDFVPQYLNKIKSNHVDTLDEIQADVRVKLLKKFKA